ncbi:MAG TPA: hypothetical protein VMP67_13230 [Candidatus Limnocylindria bacterium]|nr:hypothetical protein [Candidatus Limnocylindria bacterium]
MDRRGTLVYVHGARDRRVEVDDHVARIERALSLAGLPLDVLPARWGEEAGASLEHIEQVLPLLGARSTGTPLEEPSPMPRDDGMLRVLLHEGPLAELEQMGRGTPAGSRDAQRREADQLLEICRTDIGSPGELITLASGGTASLAQACRLASATVEASPAYTAAHAGPVGESELVAAAGRAVAASVAAQAAQPLDVLQAVQLRIAEAVMGAAAATLLAGYLGIDVGAGLKRWATDVLLPHRARLMRDAALGPADVLLYQRDGARMRGVVARTLAEARSRGGPVLALGNSLGGIILVGLLAEPAAPKPDLLVTVGSQAPLLSLIGALEPLDGTGSRSLFAPWLNVYDRRDLLGFVAGGVWPNQPDITDREVDLGVGFPDAHGATYLSHADVYRHIRDHPALNGAPGAGAPPAQRFPIRLGPRSRPLLRLLFGVKEENAYVELNDALDARFGWFSLRIPLANVKSWSIEGPWLWLTAIGVRRGLLAGDLTFGGNHKGGVRLDFHEPVRWAAFLRTPALYVTVADMEGLAAALSARGIPGEDKRTG